jgi:hypothetical protein
MFHNISQNTDEWLEMRKGKVTGSAIAKIMANYGKAFGEPAKKLAVDIAVVQLGGPGHSDNYSNAHMERGHEQEPLARKAYEDHYFCDVDNGGFFDNGKTGCSPDGLVGSDGVIEIKSVIPSVHYKTIQNGGFDSSYKWQFMFNMKETGREWIDFVSYCAGFPDGKKLYINRIHASQHKESFEQMDLRLAEFFALVETIKKGITS